MTFQIQSQILEFCVLSIVSKGDVYGYQLTQRLQEAMTLSESTLYPVLLRLSAGGYLSTYDKNFDGRNRRYYRLTPMGRARLQGDLKMWKEYVLGVEKIIGGDER